MVEVIYDTDVTKIHVKGHLNSDGVSEMKRHFENILKKENIKKVALFLKEVPSINSFGIGQILFFQKALQKKQTEFTVADVSPTVLEQFKAVKMDQVLIK